MILFSSPLTLNHSLFASLHFPLSNFDNDGGGAEPIFADSFVARA